MSEAYRLVAKAGPKLGAVHTLTMRHALDELADRLQSNDAVKEKASSIYLKAYEHGLVRRKSANVVLAASLYVASRLRGESRTLVHFARVTGIPRRNLARCCRFLAMRLDLRLPLQDLARCVSKLARDTNVSTSTRRVAIRIVDEATKKKRSLVSGRNPMSVAAAALYLACLLERENKTQREIAEAADVTQVTVRNNAACLSSHSSRLRLERRSRSSNLVLRVPSAALSASRVR
jgi:transcription initiation factor TFIIB